MNWIAIALLPTLPLPRRHILYCFIGPAALAPSRKVHAMDPLASNVEHFTKLYSSSHPNIAPMVGALGERRATIPSAGVVKHKVSQRQGGALTLMTGITDAAAMASSRGGPGPVGALRGFSFQQATYCYGVAQAPAR